MNKVISVYDFYREKDLVGLTTSYPWFEDGYEHVEFILESGIKKSAIREVQSPIWELQQKVY